MDGFVILVTYFIVGFGIYKLYKFIKLRQGKINLIRFDQEMNDLQFQRNRIMTLHNLLTDVDTCDLKDNQYKVFNISWKNEITGEVLNYDLYIYNKKSANAIALKNLAEIEIKDMSPKLKEDIERLKLRSKMMSTKSNKISKTTIKTKDGSDINFMI